MGKSFKNLKQTKKISQSRIIARLKQIQKRDEEIFKEDRILLQQLKREINAQQKRAS